MRVSFIKCHGSGNDFAMLDGRDLALDYSRWARIAVALADRRGTVGGDGILILQDADDGCDFAMAMRNPDGSEAETCLNGLRCVARAGFAAFGIERATVQLKVSRADVAIDPEIAPGVVTVRETAGPATLDVAAWPLHVGAARVIDMPIAALDSARAFTAVAMPNPHLVAFVDTVDEAELVALGSACEAAPEWLPERANVSFVELRENSALFVRTFERGVGLTDSCGSAMAAATYAACLTGRRAFGTELTVLNRGGMVRAVAGTDAMITLSGNATYDYAGWVDVDLERGVAGAVTVTERFPREIAAWQGLIAAIA